MPRFYAHIRKLLSSRFVLKFARVEPLSEDESGIKWATVLPICCQRFYPGILKKHMTDLSFLIRLNLKNVAIQDQSNISITEHIPNIFFMRIYKVRSFIAETFKFNLIRKD